jgi:hypothetical protein
LAFAAHGQSLRSSFRQDLRAARTKNSQTVTAPVRKAGNNRMVDNFD